jgi:AGZA family xanthine/uracil permease-like MFS transporter
MIGFAMAVEIKHLNWKNFTEAFPGILTFITIPLTFSIYAGFALGFTSFTILKGLRGQASQVHPVSWVITAFFVYNFFAY